MAKVRQWMVVGLTLALVWGSTGCRARGEPKIRIGSYPTATWGMTFADPCDLGQHGYGWSASEKNGILYTARAGHIDLAHVRSSADWTRYLYEKVKTCLSQGETDFTFKSNVEVSLHRVHIDYPADWADRSPMQQQAAIRQVAIEAGQYLTFIASTWHEILTWYGHRYVGPFPEYASAFSWDDSFSNLLGTRLAGQVLQQDPNDFDRRITVALARELQDLGVQSRATARKITESLRGQWYSGNMPGWVTVTRRNFDVGLDDGRVTPTLVPNRMTGLGDACVSYPIPTLNRISEIGFSVEVTIVPKERIRHRILRVVYSEPSHRGKTIRPDVHFAKLMTAIADEARSKGMAW